MIISPRYRFNSYTKNLVKERNERDNIRTTNKKVKNSSNDRKKIYFKTQIRDNNIYNHLYNTINLSDREIIEKKISLSNVYNINNTINIGSHPINMSLRPVDFNRSYYMENNNLNMYDLRKLINNRKVLKKIILIQSFVRSFLSHKKYYNKLLNSKNGLQRSKIVLYKKKLPINNKNTAYYLQKKLIKNNEVNTIIKKHNINNNFFFTKTIVNNGYYDKKKISLIQKYWRKRKNELIISNYSRLSNFQTQSEIASKFYNNSQRINLMKRTHNDSILMNSLSSFKENEEEENNKSLDKSKFGKSIKLTKSTNKGIFSKFYSTKMNIKRPRYIQINHKNNQTVTIGRGDDDEKDEEIFQYEVNEDESFKGRSFTLLRDKNQNGNYIQQVKAYTGKKMNPKEKRINIGMTYKKSRKQYFINSQEMAKLSKNKEYEKIHNQLKMWQKNEIFFKYYKGNILKYKDLKPNKNFICINSYKKEKLLLLGRKKNIISKPKISSMKKINNNGKNNLLKKNPMKLISKYFISDKSKESNLILERNLIMKKPFQFKKLNIKI
jgi:hypothetical protein